MVEKIKLYLREKIEETEKLYKIGFPSEIGPIKIRNYQFSIKPVKYTKNPDRKAEDDGLQRLTATAAPGKTAAAFQGYECKNCNETKKDIERLACFATAVNNLCGNKGDSSEVLFHLSKICAKEPEK